MIRSQYSYRFFQRIIYIALLLCVFIPQSNVFSATLSIIPSLSQVNAGNIINVSVAVNTQGVAVNNSEAIIQFPPDLLQVVSVDNSSSIFSLWVENPSFSNSTGQVSFNGGAPNPGYTGNNGRILSVTFLAKKAGTATILIGDSSVRANDGLGTDVLSTKSSATINISNSAVPVSQPEVAVPSQPKNDQALIVTSSTHPQQKTWYNLKTALLSWNNPSDATAIKTFFGSHADSDTSVLYTPAISSKKIESIDDGIWYFHVNYKTARGWSPITHYRLQVDSTSPKDFSMQLKKSDFGGATVVLQASDALSGVDHFTISVDNEKPIVVPADQSGSASTYLPINSTGTHTVVGRVYDSAGNVSETSSNIETSVPASLTIDSYPSAIKVNEVIDLTGTSPYPNATLSVSIQRGADSIQTFNVTSDGSSKYHFVSRPIEQTGAYTVWVNLIQDDGSIILTSRKVKIEVSKPIILQIGSYTTTLMTVLTPLLALIILFILLIYYGWHRFFILRKKMRGDHKLIEEKVHRSLKMLSEEVTKQLSAVEKTSSRRKVSADEKKAILELKSAIADIDSYIEKQIDSLEK